MPESKLTTATRARDKAQAELNLLLESGADATEARAALETAQAAVDEAQAAEGERQQANAAKQQQEAQALVKEITSEINKRQTEIIAGIKLPDPPELDAAQAQVILKARSEAAEARTALQDAEQRLSTLKARHADLSKQWASIVARRADGDTRDDDPGELAVLQADREGVQGLMDQATADIREAKVRVEAAGVALKSAERRWTGTVYSAWCRGLSEIEYQAETVICATAEDRLRRYKGTQAPDRYSPVHKDFVDHLEAVHFSPYKR